MRLSCTTLHPRTSSTTLFPPSSFITGLCSTRSSSLFVCSLLSSLQQIVQKFPAFSLPRVPCNFPFLPIPDKEVGERKRCSRFCFCRIVTPGFSEFWLTLLNPFLSFLLGVTLSSRRISLLKQRWPSLPILCEFVYYLWSKT